MTDYQRDLGRAISVSILLLIILIAMFTSCTVYKQPQMKITSVLAVTAEGDTLKLPIDVIRPIYNYNTYPTNRYPVVPNYFYYSPWRNHARYDGNSTYSNYGNTNNNNNSNNTAPATTIKPSGNISNPPNPVISNPRKNN